MSAPRLSNTLTETDRSEDRVDLVISLTAVPSIHLTQMISAVLNRHFGQPYSFLGTVDDALLLNLKSSDPGLVKTEALAKSLLKIPGVKKLKAARICTRRGPLYEIRLASNA